MSPLDLPLGPGGEFDLIRAIAERLGPKGRHLGDDCALISVDGATLVLSTDMSIEGAHFQTGWLSDEEIGWRSAMGALSDLAAAGAECLGLLAAVSVPHQAQRDRVVAVMDGVGQAVAACGGAVLGGDLTAAPVWALAITVIGRASRPASRHGARPGDGLWVTGQLGGARAALAAWQDGREPAAGLRQAFARPAARIAAGQWLVQAGARAMMDLSDGLAGDAHHLANASGVALDVNLDVLPVAEGVAEEGARLGRAAVELAAEGGEDYELLAALPETFGASEAASFQSAVGLPITRVGDVRAGAGVVLHRAGATVELHGFDHFR